MGPIREMLSNSGLTEQQWRILRVLDELGPLDSTKLSENASLLLPSQTRIVQTLLEKGLVTRQADPSDRRRQTVAITPAGQQIILDNLDEAQRLAAHIETVLGKETVDRLLDILEEFDRL
ncbi:MarR family transcriptional regulator [uncultured Roseibium sp.]|uniref:MarR family transcriptional regulator n=1 Tax=uncultured Roseibium sp. TaxID=1936171 RepID=UPI003217AF9B